jgi:hypothetical protein
VPDASIAVDLEEDVAEGRAMNGSCFAVDEAAERVPDSGKDLSAVDGDVAGKKREGLVDVFGRICRRVVKVGGGVLGMGKNFRMKSNFLFKHKSLRSSLLLF